MSETAPPSPPRAMTVAQHLRVEELLRGGHSADTIATLVGVAIDQVERIKGAKKAGGRRR